MGRDSGAVLAAVVGLINGEEAVAAAVAAAPDMAAADAAERVGEGEVGVTEDPSLAPASR